MNLTDETTLGAIQRLFTELGENNAKIRSMRDNIKDVLLQNEEYQQLQEELKQLTTKRQQAKKLLDSDRDFQTLNSELEELKFNHKDLLEIMSHHLVVYRDETKHTTVKDPEGEARQIILSAKIGKPAIETVSMFP